MALDKQMREIHRKLDLILNELGVKDEGPAMVTIDTAGSLVLTPQEQAAIDNAPETPAAEAPGADAPRVNSLNAPVTPAAIEKPKGKK